MRTIGVIGAGVMGEALINALIKSGVDGATIAIHEKRVERAHELTDKYGVIAADLPTVAGKDVVLLVVKPQDMDDLCAGTDFGTDSLIISFAAGKSTSLVQKLTHRSRIIRVMPNTPTLVGEGMAAFSTTSAVQEGEKKFLRDFLGASGRVIEVPEELQDAVTATSGSGPAYFFAFVEAMVEGAQELGLSHNDATTLVLQTIVGAAALLERTGKSATELREQVTSPQGTTAAALHSFESAGLKQIVKDAMKAAHKRSQELA